VQKRQHRLSRGEVPLHVRQEGLQTVTVSRPARLASGCSWAYCAIRASMCCWASRKLGCTFSKEANPVAVGLKGGGKGQCKPHVQIGHRRYVRSCKWAGFVLNVRLHRLVHNRRVSQSFACRILVFDALVDSIMLSMLFAGLTKETPVTV
jgi:hypothetical protein